ncbi:HVA22-like protein a isoform X2 [Phalaenopsis equestris]|uniref:HVA22-like protein a isoform X2 n=1 Tax=Phalaenopsis equestris TaxID=78828 RepID=UPI0009E31499|nr:HVA22-like protein a isoform X2 [Phalaenopsis equestris]
MGSRSLIKVLAKNFDVLAGYASVKAIETKSTVDDQQWLTYWVLHSLLTLFELTFAKLIEWLPFWPYAKLIFSCWLVFPYFSGAAYVYQHYVRAIFLQKPTVNIWYVPPKNNIFSEPDDVLFAAERFIEENGPDAFEKLINKARRASDENTGKGAKGKKYDVMGAEKIAKLKKKKKHVSFNLEKEERASKLEDYQSHAIYDEVWTDNEPKFWSDSSFSIFDEDYRYWK